MAGTHPELLKLLTTPVDVIKLSRDSMGNISADSTTLSVKAFVEFVKKNVYNAAGIMVTTTAVVYLPYDAPEMGDTPSEWQIWFNGKTLQVISVDEVRDPRDGSLHHYEVMTV